MQCPICDYSTADDQLRCPQCGKAMTVWKNLDMFADSAYTAGLNCLKKGAPTIATEMFFKAIVFAPENSRFLYTLGCSLAQQHRYLEAIDVLGKLQRLQPTEQAAAALAKAQQLEEAESEPEPEM